jgi:enamine deaminase RidA (YjgF/YER057c/UK114 family)
VLRITVAMPSITDFEEMNEIYNTCFKENNYPARASIEAKMGNLDFPAKTECLAQLYLCWRTAPIPIGYGRFRIRY